MSLIDDNFINNRLLDRKKSSNLIIKQTTPDAIKDGTKIFVVGPPRSGTTLVYSMLANEFFLPECTFVSTLMKVFDETYKFSDDERFNYYGHNLANTVEIFKKPIYDLLYTAISKVGGNSSDRFVYKDPILSLYLEYFELFFDHSFKIVFCVRDPRDVVSSMYNVLKKQNDISGERHVAPVNVDRTTNLIYALRHMWRSITTTPDDLQNSETDALLDKAINIIFPFYQKIHNIDTVANFIDKDKIFFVKYEHIAAGNNEAIQNLETFLGFSINLHGGNENVKGKLDETSPFYSENYGKTITTNPIGKYKNSFTPEQIKKIERVFSYYMKKFNYE